VVRRKGNLGDFRGVRRGGQKSCVEPVVAQPSIRARRLVFPQLDGEAGIGLAQGLEQDGHQVRGERWNYAKLKRADERVAGGAGHSLHLGGFGQGSLSMGQNLAADGGNVDALVGALEQGDAEFDFELADLAAEGGLADVAGLGGAAKMAVSATATR